MDVASYFQNVLSSSYMVRVQFNGAEYDALEDGAEKTEKPSKQAGKGKKGKKRDSGRYKSQPMRKSVLEEGILAPEAIENLLSQLDDFNRRKAEREDCLKVLLATHILRGTGDTVDGEFAHEALLVIPANASMEGALSYPADWKGRAPWMPRPLLEEQAVPGVSKAEISVGSYADYDSYVSGAVARRDAIDNLPEDKQWRAYAEFAQGLYHHVFRITDEELADCELMVDDEALYLLIDTSVNASAPIEELYQRIRTQGKGSHEIALFNAMTELRQREQLVARLEDDGVEEVLDHAGAASREYPLADSQRLALHRYGVLPEGEVLAVSGPPGTGKTTLLQSIVADLLVHRALQKPPKPPVIVGTSTNNQAVTNIVDAFTKEVKQEQGDSVFRRWLPDIAKSDDGDGFEVDEDAPLHSLGVYSPSAGKKEEALDNGYLLDELARRGDGLYQQCIGPEFSETAARVYCTQAGSYLGKAYNSPSHALIDVHKRLARIDELRRELVRLAASGVTPEAGAHGACKPIVEELTSCGALDEKGHAISLDACKSVDDLDEALDITVRPLEFWLAIHVFEGMWLTASWLKNSEKKKELFSYEPEIVDRYHKQMAMLMPLTVMTMYRLPRQFVCADAEGRRNQAQFGAIDLLIVDEAGQVDAAVGIAAFALARRAIVVGDVFQLPPVWGQEPDSDFMIAQGFMGPGEDQQMVWEQLQARGLTASNSSSVMAAAQGACPWAYDAAGVVADDGQAELAEYMGYADTSERDDGNSQGGLFLSEHRRCVDSIIGYCNELIYGGKLEPKRGNEQKADVGLPAMGFCAIDGKAALKGTSRRNPAEAKAIAMWIRQNIERLWRAYDEASDDGADPEKVIGVVTPFSAQAAEVKYQLRSMGKIRLGGKEQNLSKFVKVGTAHRLQGAECPVVLFSLVYDAGSNPSFVENNPNLMNVAVSRAKDAFIVFGSEKLMRQAGGNGVMGWLKHYCYKHRVEPPEMVQEESVRKSKVAPLDHTKPDRGNGKSGSQSQRRKPYENGGKKGSADGRGKAAKSGKPSRREDQTVPSASWATSAGSLSMTQARKASIAAGFWPKALETEAVSVLNTKLEGKGLLERPDGKNYSPTDEGRAIGISRKDGNDGAFWPVYTEAAMREIAQRLM